MYKTSEPKLVLLKDYQVPFYQIQTLDLCFHLDKVDTALASVAASSSTPIDSHLYTEVVAVLKMTKDAGITSDSSKGGDTKGQAYQSKDNTHHPLVLDGENLKLVSLQLDDQECVEGVDYLVTEHNLTLLKPTPTRFSLKIVTHIKPQDNTSLTGLYKSKNLFCTQCEAQGFRHITYYLDRPDVMTTFTTKIIADKTLYPQLLSNGNPVESGNLDGNLHYVTWKDPFPKPCYLFALVAGNLACIKETFITHSRRKVAIEFYVEHDAKHQCNHAINSLKDSMAWDEKTYGREYDLDIYMVVAVHDFNMGAMENKGLNVFNTKYVLADAATATDIDYRNIDAVIGHEYFHNWTGNRVTCRDWFQLSLKEGLTVFREQQFSSRHAHLYNRIQEVRLMRNRQFIEDSGPMAHPVRPDSYMEINNFYTVTIYDKGAEVIRMMHTILNQSGFRKGLDLYFERHDGQAVTCDDFVKAMEDANGVDFTQFKRWYHQAGTPTVKVSLDYQPKTGVVTLTAEQNTKPTPKQPTKEPFYIPIRLQLYNENGELLSFVHEQAQGNDKTNAKTEDILILKDKVQSFTLSLATKDSQKVIPSLFGDFSAPVKVQYDYQEEDLALLMRHDCDLFNRWEASQKWLLIELCRLVQAFQDNKSVEVNKALIMAYSDLLSTTQDRDYLAQALSFPAFEEVGECFDKIDVDNIIKAMQTLRFALAVSLESNLEKLYLENHNHTARRPYEYDEKDMSCRGLKNVALYYLCMSNPKHILLAKTQFEQANNMTDTMGALKAINDLDSPIRDEMLHSFFDRFKDNLLVVCKWLSLEATSIRANTLQRVKDLTNSDAFDWKNPNKIYALIGGLSMSNPAIFHDGKGEGYEFLKEVLLKLDATNPQVSARMAEALTRHKRYISSKQVMMQKQLESLNASTLSPNLKEIVVKSL